MSLHSDTLSWFGANQSLLFLLNAAFLAEKQQIPILGRHKRFLFLIDRFYQIFSSQTAKLNEYG
jgi:hypothetical protein